MLEVGYLYKMSPVLEKLTKISVSSHRNCNLHEVQPNSLIRV